MNLLRQVLRFEALRNQWFERVARATVGISVGERSTLLTPVHRLVAGSSGPRNRFGERQTLADASRGMHGVFAGRVLPFDEKAGLTWARLMAEGKDKWRLRSGLDIAAVADAYGCVVVTNNEKDFEGIEIIHPLWGDSNGGRK